MNPTLAFALMLIAPGAEAGLSDLSWYGGARYSDPEKCLPSAMSGLSSATQDLNTMSHDTSSMRGRNFDFAFCLLGLPLIAPFLCLFLASDDNKGYLVEMAEETAEMLRSDIYKIFNDWVIKTVLDPLKLNKNEELIIQDIDIPVETSAEWIRKFLKVVPSAKIGKIKLRKEGLQGTLVPIWLCPVVGTGSPLMPMKQGQLYINFGFWDALEGPETKGGNAAGKINKALENACIDFGAKKTLYSAAYFTEEEFSKQYNGELYQRIKTKYDPEGRVRSWYDRLTRS